VRLRAVLPCLVVLSALVGRAEAQDGAIGGQVVDSATGRGLPDVSILIDGTDRGAVTDSGGYYRVRQVRSGTWALRVRRIGYRAGIVRGVVVRSGETARVDVALAPRPVELEELEFQAEADSALDPFQVRTEQRYSGIELRQLPVSSLDEALELSAGAVGTSYRGGRPGEQSFILDGLGVKNQLDAATNDVGLRIPPDMLTEASLITNGFSARYGQAISGMVNVVTRDGSDNWQGMAAIETDRPFGSASPMGLDRVIFIAEGPVASGIRAVASVDMLARTDFDPAGGPAPTDPLDPRSSQPLPLPHNSGEQLSFAGKLFIPLGARETVRLFGLHSVQQQELYDQRYKYDLAFAPVLSFNGTLLSAAFQHASSPRSRRPLVLDVRLGYLTRDFVRGMLANDVEPAVGAFTFKRYEVVGEDMARARDTLSAMAPIPGMYLPAPSSSSPWGVPAFFQAQGSAGEVAWNAFTELRSQVDATLGLGSRADLYFGGEYLLQTVKTFQRTLGYLPVGDSVPPATASDFSPRAGALYAEMQYRVRDLGFTAGLRYDRFDSRQDFGDSTAAPQNAFSPRVAVSTVLKGATLVSSFGYFTQPPDYQFLVNQAFMDTARTGRFRVGNPNLGFERAWQFEFNLRFRPRPDVLVRTGVYARNLYGLVASVPFGFSPDSAVFSNNDMGSVRGFEAIVERPILRGWGARFLYTLQFANATATSPFVLRRAFTIDPATGDTIYPASVEFPLDYDRRHTVTAIVQGIVPPGVGPRIGRARPFGKWELAFIGRLLSGLPYTALPSTPGAALGTPNQSRLPWTSTVDVLFRRPVELGQVQAAFYFDARNLLGRENVVAVRRDTGTPFATNEMIEAAAMAAYTANPQPIPFESPRYRRFADANGDGLVAGEAELVPLYRRAAKDYYEPVFYYGPPRVMRLGLEFLF